MPSDGHGSGVISEGKLGVCLCAQNAIMPGADPVRYDRTRRKSAVLPCFLLPGLLRARDPCSTRAFHRDVAGDRVEVASVPRFRSRL